MSPAQEAVQVSEADVELVILGGPNQDRVVQSPRFLPDGCAQRPNPRIRTDALAILHSGVKEPARNSPVHVDPRNHERAEEVALAAFVDAEVRLKHLRRMDFLIAQFRFPQNLRLQLELHEFFDAFPLHQNLWPFFVNGDTELILFRKKNGIWLGSELEA